MKLNLSDAKAFRELLSNDTILESTFGQSGKKILSNMEENGIVSIKRLNRRSREVSLISMESLNSYLNNHFSIQNLDAYIDTLQSSDISRAALAKAGLSTKIRSNNPKAGFHMNSYDNVEVTVNSDKLKINFPIGTALFIHKDAKLQIDPQALIVGVENFSNILSIESQSKLFQTDKKILFIERSKYLQQLLAEVENEYMHWGDIDLAGIHIYLGEYHKIVKDRGRFFIPNTIREDLKSASNELYKKQFIKYKFLKSDIPYIQELIDLIRKNETTIEQEYYI